jgi:hypothetical protein
MIELMTAFNAFLGKVEAAIINPLITLIALGAFVVFIWGVVDFIGGAANEEKRKTGQQHMIWGLIGLVILFGAKAIVMLMANTIGVDAHLSGSASPASRTAPIAVSGTHTTAPPRVDISGSPEPLPRAGDTSSASPAPSQPANDSYRSDPRLDVSSGPRSFGEQVSLAGLGLVQLIDTVLFGVPPHPAHDSTHTSPPQTPTPAPPVAPPVASTNLVLFAGQSNALGFGNTGPAPYTPTERVQIWSGSGFSIMTPGVNTGTPANPTVWGPEVAFANDWLAAHPEGTLYLGKVVKGSTPLAQADGLDWSPRSTDELFDQAKATANAMLAARGAVALDAVFWMQGEQDATVSEWAAQYGANLTAFLSAVRSEWMHNAQGYVAAGQISDSTALAYNQDVRAAELGVDQADPNLETFPTAGFTMQADGLHYAAQGHISLGHAFYEAWAH